MSKNEKTISRDAISGKFSETKRSKNTASNKGQKEHIGAFVKKFYAKHGEVMSRLAHE